MRPRLIGILSLALVASAHAETPPGPYWIVAGSFANPDYADTQYGSIKRASAEVARCGLKSFNDFSGKFEGFSEGFDVVVVGGYATQAAAESDLKRLRRCIPEAYIRRGTYQGE